MSRDRTGPIRIGRIDYTNVWPVFHHFDPSSLPCRPEVITGMPADLNRKLREGEVDIAAVSSFAYGQNHEDYLLLPDLSVSTRGSVQSILLFLKSPLEQALNGKIALTTTSATSVNLLKIILEKFYGGHPEYTVAEPDLDQMLAHADGALLIGDHAIRASWRDHGCEIIDLGASWHAFTGLGMTYAVWALRRETAADRPDEVAQIYEALIASKRIAARDMGPIIAQARGSIGGTDAYWQGYFRGLCHDFGPPQREGLSLYFRYAKELGFMDRTVDIAEWNPSRTDDCSAYRRHYT